MKTLQWNIKKFFWRLKNSWSWAKFAWNIKWYEYTDIYAVIKFSLQKTINYFENASVQHEGTHRDLEYMRLCIKLIDRIETDYYMERMEEELQKRWGEYEKLEVEAETDKVYTLNIRRKMEVTEEDSKMYHQDFRRTSDYWYAKQDKAKRLLFNILNNRIEHWWL